MRRKNRLHRTPLDKFVDVPVLINDEFLQYMMFENLELPQIQFIYRLLVFQLLRRERCLVRQWIHVRVSSRGCGRLCLATETGTHSANCAAFCLDKGVVMPVVMLDRRSVQTVLKPVEAPQVQFPGKVVVDMPVVVLRQGLVQLSPSTAGGASDSFIAKVFEV